MQYYPRDTEITRLRQFVDRVRALRYGHHVGIDVRYTYDQQNPILIEELASRQWLPIHEGTRWGELWGSAWFHMTGVVPNSHRGNQVVALIDVGSEACVFRNERPYQGLTDERSGEGRVGRKRRVHMFSSAVGGEDVSLLVEAGANAINGYEGHNRFVLRQAQLAVLRADYEQLALDLEFLLELVAALPPADVRGRRVLRGLADAARVWADGHGIADVQRICRNLLKSPAAASATTAWSVGHGHLDLAWLWPERETRRKAGRTFATALRLLQTFPDYFFGASQPQIYEWVREDYPALFDEIAKAVADGRWECQGAAWVEPDTNLPSGESLVRQFLYGKRFFRTTFGVDVTNLWLPDAFGYSAALPQIMKLADIEYLVSQKLSWNEINRFPHHTFDWEGIDGSRVRVHFLAADTYNNDNTPGALIAAQERFAQADVSADWLNLFGVGDGGGGPSRRHVEFARRAHDTEGAPKVRMSTARAFFDTIADIPASRLPLWRGELYLEKHRGTYTTQAEIKRLNRRIEHAIHDCEFLSVLSGCDQRERLCMVWKSALMQQFHDILPGSSIARVNREARRRMTVDLATVADLTRESLTALFGSEPDTPPPGFVVINTLSWERHELVPIPWSGDHTALLSNESGVAIPVQREVGTLLVPLKLPPMGYVTLTVDSSKTGTTALRQQAAAADEKAAKEHGAEERRRLALWRGSRAPERPVAIDADSGLLENSRIRVCLEQDGTIRSIYDKHRRCEALAGAANRLLLWEDYPYGWDAWDISYYYRETEPEQARLVERGVTENGPLRGVVRQSLSIGRSRITQDIILEAETSLLRIDCKVEWAEDHRQLRVVSEPEVNTDSATYEIQFGVVKRPTHENTSWDAAKFEVPGHRFADFSQADYGFAIVNDSKYGYRAKNGALELTLLRSPSAPDPTADRGIHRFSFAYFPHAGRFEDSAVLERAHELNSPPIVRPIEGEPAFGSTPFSAFELSNETVKLETVKPAEDGAGVILRLYETRGGSPTVVIRSSWPIRHVEEVNLLEESFTDFVRHGPSMENGSGTVVRLGFGPFQVRSVRLQFA